MIIRRCRNISDQGIHSVTGWMRAADLITPEKVYRTHTVTGLPAKLGEEKYA